MDGEQMFSKYPKISIEKKLDKENMEHSHTHWTIIQLQIYLKRKFYNL
jgi:hypothetical protein